MPPRRAGDLPPAPRPRRCARAGRWRRGSGAAMPCGRVVVPPAIVRQAGAGKVAQDDRRRLDDRMGTAARRARDRTHGRARPRRGVGAAHRPAQDPVQATVSTGVPARRGRSEDRERVHHVARQWAGRLHAGRPTTRRDAGRPAKHPDAGLPALRPDAGLPGRRPDDAPRAPPPTGGSVRREGVPPEGVRPHAGTGTARHAPPDRGGRTADPDRGGRTADPCRPGRDPHPVRGREVVRGPLPPRRSACRDRCAVVAGPRREARAQAVPSPVPSA